MDFASFSPDSVLFPEDSLRDIKLRTYRFAREECPLDACPIESALIECVNQSVAQAAANSQIDTHISILAMRLIKDCINSESCNGQESSYG
ncbi:MAG: hypothetical protein KC435_09735 [Thermomicrobiales bacterium]|nr:hypothetical protein [Thermomicrobiales bacterium]